MSREWLRRVPRDQRRASGLRGQNRIRETVGGFLEEKASEPSWKDGHLMGQAGSGRERKERGSEVPAGPVPAWWRLPPPSLLQLPGPSPRPKSPRTASQDELARIELNC